MYVVFVIVVALSVLAGCSAVTSDADKITGIPLGDVGMPDELKNRGSSPFASCNGDTGANCADAYDRLSHHSYFGNHVRYIELRDGRIDNVNFQNDGEISYRVAFQNGDILDVAMSEDGYADIADDIEQDPYSFDYMFDVRPNYMYLTGITNQRDVIAWPVDEHMMLYLEVPAGYDASGDIVALQDSIPFDGVGLQMLDEAFAVHKASTTRFERHGGLFLSASGYCVSGSSYDNPNYELNVWGEEPLYADLSTQIYDCGGDEGSFIFGIYTPYQVTPHEFLREYFQYEANANQESFFVGGISTTGVDAYYMHVALEFDDHIRAWYDAANVYVIRGDYKDGSASQRPFLDAYNEYVVAYPSSAKSLAGNYYPQQV